jgi:hypothetical protein
MSGDKNGKTDPLEVDISEIPLPPDELTEALDNSQPDVGQSPAEKPEVAALDFLSDAGTREVAITLDHPFRFDGRDIRTIKVRKLTVVEVAEVSGRAGRTGFDIYEIYAAMTGLPAAVLRGLLDDDGEAVIGKAYDFLPRAFRTEGD